jgi:hypothetical protein
MVDYKRPKLAKVGKVGHANAGKHKPLDLVAARSKLKVLAAQRKGLGAKVRVLEHGAKGLEHGAKGLRAEFGLPAKRKGQTR